MKDIKTDESSEISKIIDKFSPFLYELRKKVIILALFFAFSSLFGFFFYERIIRVIITLLNLNGVNIVFTSPFQFINLAISCGATSGLVLSIPVLLYLILSFIKPGLKRWEYSLVVRLVPFSLILFVVGFIFGALVMKWQIEIFLTHSKSLGIGNVLDISRLLSTVILTAALMGILFEFPIVVLILLKLGVIKRQLLGKYRLYIYVLSFVIAIFLPPDSILADILLSLPLIILFELTLIIDRIYRRK